MDEKFWILIQISLQFANKSPINNKSMLIQVMAWHQDIVWTSFNKGSTSSAHTRL